MRLHLHQTHHTIADFAGVFKTLKQVEKNEGLHLFPELFLTGYPLQDLCLQKSFISRYQDFLGEINRWCQGLKTGQWQALLGGIDYTLDEAGLPLSLKNAIFLLEPGRPLRFLYAKRLLPNYDIFDEKKYFTPGPAPVLWECQGKTLALMICEDMWASSAHPVDPCLDILSLVQEKKLQLDAIINLSASPFHLGKNQKRQERAREISAALGAPFVYVNRVGGEDEILFDGQSFIMAHGKVELLAARFEAQDLSHNLPEAKTALLPTVAVTEHPWESLFSPALTLHSRPPQLQKWSEEESQEVLEALIFGVREYASKNGMDKFVVALSGGMDSALVLTIVKLALKEQQSVEAIYMPGLFSATQSFELSEALCKNLQIGLKILPIKFLHTTCRNSFRESFNRPMQGTTDENIQSRLRSLLLFARSNDQGSMVLNTSNKSEIAVGYSTLYGDSAGALSVLGDLYKTEVYQLAHYINARFGHPIPSGIIERAPSAELRENQTDAQTLLPYEILDAILEGILCNRYTVAELVKQGFDREQVKKVLSLFLKSEYKRGQFCPILKVKAKSFGFGHRVPLSKHLDYAMDESVRS